MGERLNIEIKKDDKCLANAYYHWSAYTRDACALTEIVLNALSQHDNIEVFEAIDALQTTGAGLPNEEIDAAVKLTGHDAKNFNKFNNRNDGIICVTDEGIKQTRMAEEGRVEIDVERKIIHFGVFFELTENDLEDIYDPKEIEKYNIDPRNFPELHFNPYAIPFEDFGAFVNEIKDSTNGWLKCKPIGGILEIIE